MRHRTSPCRMRSHPLRTLPDSAARPSAFASKMEEGPAYPSLAAAAERPRHLRIAWWKGTIHSSCSCGCTVPTRCGSVATHSFATEHSVAVTLPFLRSSGVRKPAARLPVRTAYTRDAALLPYFDTHTRLHCHTHTNTKRTFRSGLHCIVAWNTIWTALHTLMALTTTTSAGSSPAWLHLTLHMPATLYLAVHTCHLICHTRTTHCPHACTHDSLFGPVFADSHLLVSVL